MRMKYLIFLIPAILIFNTAEADAQIWKKIKNKTKQKVEERAAEKISEKLADAIIGKMSEKFEVESNPYSGGTKISKPENLPEMYSFDWKYQLKMTNNQGEEDINFDYRLSSEGNYFGYSMQQSQDMFSVVDSENEAIVSYMEEDGKSFAMSYSYPVSDVAQNTYMQGAGEEVEITELPERKILGYNARGYEIKTPETQMTVYVTSEAGISFSGLSGLPEQGVPRGFTQNMEETENTLLLYMKFTDNEGREMEMECVSLKEESFSKNNKDYNFL